MADGKKVRDRLYWSIFFVLIGITSVLNLCAWMSRGFADAYRRFVFPVWGSTLGRLTALFPFSVGEFMIFFGIAYLAAAAAALVIMLWGRLHRRPARHAAGFLKGFAMTLTVLALVMTLNCFIVYHCSTFSSL